MVPLTFLWPERPQLLELEPREPRALIHWGTALSLRARLLHAGSAPPGQVQVLHPRLALYTPLYCYTILLLYDLSLRAPRPSAGAAAPPRFTPCTVVPPLPHCTP
eukprot:8338008-Pyramimonas_sp.AAC.1